MPGGGYIGLEEEIERTIVVDVWGAGAVFAAVFVVRVDGAPHKVLELDAAKLFPVELFDTRRGSELLVVAGGLAGPVIASEFAFAFCGFAFCAAQVVHPAVNADATAIRRVRVEIFRKLLLGLVAAVAGVDDESVGVRVRPVIKLCQQRCEWESRLRHGLKRVASLGELRTTRLGYQIQRPSSAHWFGDLLHYHHSLRELNPPACLQTSYHQGA
jgi:hypothetical protein